MRFFNTDFFNYEQVVIDEIRSRGLFVSTLVDCGGPYWKLMPKAWVNRFGFVITDVDPFEGQTGSYKELTDEEFHEKFGNEESESLMAEVKVIREDIADKIAAAKAEYDAKEPEREASIKAALAYQDNTNERAWHYKLRARKDNPFILDNGYKIVIQEIEKISDTEQEVMYFIDDPEGKIFTKTTKKKVKFNCQYKTMIKAIAAEHNLVS